MTSSAQGLGADAFGEVAVLMNEMGTGGGGELFSDRTSWRPCSSTSTSGA